MRGSKLMKHNWMANQKFATIKSLLIRIKTKSLNQDGQKVDFFIHRTISLNFRPSHRSYFPFEKIVQGQNQS